MNLLQGIQLHELILMILGFILGLALIFIFLYTALRGHINLKLLYGFVAPIVMIGYPSIRSVQFGNEVVKIDKLVSKVNENPTDTTAQIELINNLRQLPASRCTTSVDAMTAIANAQAALGQYDSAKVTIKKAIILDSKSEKAQASQKDIQEKWQTQKVFENQINYLQGYVDEYQKDKNKKYLRDSITTVLNRLNVNTPVHLEDKKVLVVAHAASVVGETQAAEDITNKVLEVNPDNREAVKMREDIKREAVKQRIPLKTKPSTTTRPTEKTRPQAAVPAPAPVFQDTGHLLRKFQLVPKSVKTIEKWDKNN